MPRAFRRVALVLVFILLFFTGCGPASSTSPQESTHEPAALAQSELASKASQPAQPTRIPVIAATVTKVIDGDTFRAHRGSGREERVRLTGVDTPESTKEVEPYGKEAAAYTKKRLCGRTVYLELDVGQRDKYGRLLAYAWLSPPESASEPKVRAKMFNAELLLAGMAQVMTVPPNVKYVDLFVRLQRETREAGKGL